MDLLFIKLLDLFYLLLIKGIFISVLIVLFVKKIAKNKIDTTLSLQIIRWVILIYAFGVIIHLILSAIFKENTDNMNDLNTPYWIFHFITNSVIPLTLLNNKLSKKAYYILTISVLMNLAWLFESFIIHVPALFRNLGENNYSALLPFPYEAKTITKGLILGLVSLFIGNGFKNRRWIKAKLKIKSESVNKQ